MTQLIGISLVFWHLFPKADIRFSGNSAILGKNASGKSTLIDLIQAVMTGGSGSLYKFNRSAGEGGGRSERTLRSYCLGQTDEGVTVRDQGITHIALIFGGAGLARPVTIGLCLEVALNEEARVVGRYVADGVAAGTDLFLESTDGSDRPAAWAVVRSRLKSACQQSGGELHEHQPPTAARVFIREYMRVLFTARRSPDPERFIKAFIMALSFEDMRSVEEFVRSYLLEKNDIDIAELRDSIKRYQQIQREIAELEKRLAALRPIREQIEQFQALVNREAVAQQMQRLADLLECWGDLFANLSMRRAKQAELNRIKEDLKRLNGDIAYAEAEQESVRAQIEASGFEAKRHALRQEIALADLTRDQLISRLRQRFAPVARALELIPSRERLQAMGLGLGQVLGELEAIAEEGRGLVPPAWPKSPEMMEQLIARAIATAGDRLPKLTSRHDEATALRVESERQAAELAAQMAESREGRVALDPKTVALMEVLRQAGFRPRALCQVIDIVDESWREAVEALLGRDRETIIVDPEHAEQAVSLLRRERSRFFGSRVANTRKLVNSPSAGQNGTLASVVGGNDALAMSYVVFRIGNVQLAETQAELLAGGRAVMRDATYYDGIAVEVRRARDLKVGRVAANLMLDVLRRQMDDQQQVVTSHRRNEALLKDVCNRLQLFTAPVPASERLDLIAIELTDVEGRRADLLERIERIGMLVDPKLLEAQTRIKATLATLRDDKEQRRQDIGGLEAELRQVEHRLAGGELAAGSWHALAHRRRLFRERVNSRAVFQAIREPYAQRRGSKGHGRLSEELVVEIKRLAEERQERDGGIRDDVGDYCLDFAIERPFGREARIIADIKPWVIENIDLLEGNDLVRYRRQADEAAERVTYLFRSSFVHELNSRFRTLEKEIEDLRTALRSKRLHGEVYSLHAQLKSEFRPLHDLARASETDHQVLTGLFGSVGVDHPFASAIADVERLLRDENASFEIYQDYRNYYNFELRMRNADNHETSFDRRRGVASGAERQTPFYVIIGAALSSIYHGTRRSGEGALGLGLAVFDEAFSKMDGQNQRTMLQFYNEIGLQVVIAAPTEKRAVVYENLDSVIDVYRFGKHAEAEVSKIKERARQALWEANPEHLSEEDLLLRLADAADDQATGSVAETVADGDETVH